jgi:diadenosine tetraphosphate (Ap4A) HIT family hydrolase
VVAIPQPDSPIPCHVVVAPRRHVAAFYELDVQEQRVIWDALRELRRRVAESIPVEGFDAGFVDVAAGVEPAHTHVHLIPRIPGRPVERPVRAEWVNLEE